MVLGQMVLAALDDPPLRLPFGTIPPTGKKMDALCCDLFEMFDGKIKRLDCCPEGSVVVTQLGGIGAPIPSLSTERTRLEV